MVERLESRRLLAVGIRDFPIPTANIQPFWITQGPGAQLYFTPLGASQLGAYDPSTHSFTTIPVSGLGSSSSSYITSAPDGNLYITTSNISAILQVNPATFVVQVYPIATANLGSGKYITTGPDGNLYFTASNGNVIEGFGLTSHVFTTYLIPTANAGITGMTTGPGNLLWFVETRANKIATLDPATRVVTELPIPNANSEAAYITAGADGNLYFTEPGTNSLGQFNPTTRAFASFPIPVANSGASAITTGGDGNIYFTESGANAIGQFNPATRTFNQFVIPTANSNPTGITTGADGNVYFTETSANKIGEVVIGQGTPTPTTQLTVTPNPSVVGQVTTLIATVPTSGTAKPTGRVTFFIDGMAQPSIRLTKSRGQAQATLSTKLPDGDHLIQAVYRAGPSQPASVSNVVSLVISPAPGDGPTIFSLDRFGFHSQPTTLVLTFDKALNPASAQNPSNYRIVDSRGRRIRIASVVYDPASFTVTVSPVNRLDLHRSYRFMVTGTAPTGVTDTDGRLLDGALNGFPGSDYKATLTTRNLKSRGQGGTPSG